MKFQLDQDYHIHSNISQCSGEAEQTPENILKYAKERGLKRIALTDHFWDEAVPGASNWYSTYHKLTDLKRALPLPTDNEVEFFFGCETDMDKNGVIGISPEHYGDFDFIIVATTHMHMKGFTVSEADYGNASTLAKLWVERFDRVLESDLPFGKVGIAHLASKCIAVENNMHLEVLKLISDEEMYRLFTKAAELGLGIELNGHDMTLDDESKDIILRPFRIAKKCGCKFYYGSDAHKKREFAVDKSFPKAVELLDLSENDKFIIKKV